MSILLISVVAAAYAGLLFLVAWRADRSADRPRSPRRRALVHALSLAIYCTSWTYFGAVGTAARSGWEYLTIYLGPVLAILLLFPVWRRILAAAKRERVGSIADFLASRYAKDRRVGALVAIVAVVTSVPYIALQLKALSTMFGRLSHRTGGTPDELIVILIAAGLAGFAILFGVRRADLTDYNRGLVQAVALESLVKLAGIVAAALLAVVLLVGRGDAGAWSAALGELAAPPVLDSRFLMLTLLSATAIFCLPRQFHMAFVEVESQQDAQTARWIFPLYLLAFSLAVPPIMLAGRVVLGGSIAGADTFVADLTLGHGASAVVALVMVGGFSAATAMVVVETVALSGMISNHLVLPLAGDWWRTSPSRDIARVIVMVRRIAIVAVMALATCYFLNAERTRDLASIGLVSFAGAAQLAPALIGGMVWRQARPLGAVLGIAGGFAVWLVMLLAPQVLGHLLPWLDEGLRGLPGYTRSDPLVYGASASLAVNVGLLILGSLIARERMLDRLQASAFMTYGAPPGAPLVSRPLGRTAGDLQALADRFLGEESARRAFEAFEAEHGRMLRRTDPVDPALARAVERMLAGALGPSSARSVLARTLSDEHHDPEQVVRMLDEAAQAVQFNRELLQTTLDNLGQGVSVVDADLRLVVWNRAYMDLFGLSADQVYVGRPIAEIIRINIANVDLTPTEREAFVRRRLDHLQRGRRHVYERVRPDGRVLRSVGGPMPAGGYITSFTDITDLRRAADALVEANELLEMRVEQRTHELELAKAQAEAATDSKTHFLAAASHDLLQPLHAARLLIGALAEDLQTAPPATQKLAGDADQAIASAHRLLRALLNLSRLESGGVRPELSRVSVRELFGDLEREFGPIAREKGIELTVVDSGLSVTTDRDLLRSILQNILSNALRYTAQGKVLVGARRLGGQVRFDVLDTGPGIPADSLDRIFKAFQRLDGAPAADGGVGLGLAIVERISGLLNHPVAVRSKVGRGSAFSVLVPRAHADARAPRHTAARPGESLAGLRVICADNEPAILSALEALLRRWGAEATCVASAADLAGLSGSWDAALIDQHLGDGLGLDALRALGPRAGKAALITADASKEVAEEARRMGIVLIRKPVRPAAIKAFLLSLEARV